MPQTPSRALAAAAGYPIVADPLSGLRAGRARPIPRAGPRRPAGPPRPMDRCPRARARHPVRRHADLEAGRGAAQALDAGALSSSMATVAGARRRSSRPRSCMPTRLLPLRTWRTDSRAPRPTPVPGCADWLAADAAADATMRTWLADLDEPFEGAPFDVLADALPDDAVLWAGNSMPVRDLDGWLPSTDRRLRVVRQSRRERHRWRRLRRPLGQRPSPTPLSCWSSVTCRSCTTWVRSSPPDSRA